MNYTEFNSRIFDYYILRSSTSFCNLSIDKAEIETIIPVDHIKQFNELKSTWDNLLTSYDDIPLYIGLISIQCYAASQMQRDEYNAADAYKIRLAEVLGLDNVQILQNLFKGGNPELSIQEQIWHQAKLFFKNKLGQDLDLPAKARHAGKYVQYPKSQALLNIEDLKHFTRFFSEEFNVIEDIPFSYFQQRLLLSLKNIKQSPRTNVLLENDEKKNACIQQIYNYFNLWNGEIYDFKFPRKSTLVLEENVNISTSSRLLMTLEENQPAFFVLNERYEIINKIAVLDVLNCKNINNFKTGLQFFNESEYYKNEFISSRFLYLGVDNYILINTALLPKEGLFLENKSSISFTISKNIKLYKCRINDECKSSFLEKYIQVRNPIQLLGGIRINRKREYLSGFGPTILCSLPHSIIHDNKRCEYDPLNAKEGVYKIRVDKFRDIEILIVVPRGLEQLIESKNVGWNLRKMQLDDQFHIEGCLCKPEFEEAIRLWIDLNLRRNPKMYYKGNNLLLKAIKQATL
jgi:hypothetical protein